MAKSRHWLENARRAVGTWLRRLSERLAPTPADATDLAALRRRFPGAPDHWLQLLHRHGSGFEATRRVSPDWPAPRREHARFSGPEPPAVKRIGAKTVRYGGAASRSRPVLRFADPAKTTIAPTAERRPSQSGPAAGGPTKRVPVKFAFPQADVGGPKPPRSRAPDIPQTNEHPARFARPVASTSIVAAQFEGAFSEPAAARGPPQADAGGDRSPPQPKPAPAVPDSAERRAPRRDKDARTAAQAADARYAEPWRDDESGPRWSALASSRSKPARITRGAARSATPEASPLQAAYAGLESVWPTAVPIAVPRLQDARSPWPELPAPPADPAPVANGHAARMAQLIADQEGRGWSGSPS